MAHGGARSGAGRKPGAISKISKEAYERAKDGGELPLDYLLSVMRDDNADEAKRIDCAKAAAPYVHAKLTSIEGKLDAKLTMTEIIHRVID